MKGRVARARASSQPAIGVLLDHGRRFRESIESHPRHALVLLNWAANARICVWSRYLPLIEQVPENHLKAIEHGIEEGEVDPSVDAESVARTIISYALMSIQMRLADLEAEGRGVESRSAYHLKASWFPMNRPAGITHLRV